MLFTICKEPLVIHGQVSGFSFGGPSPCFSKLDRLIREYDEVYYKPAKKMLDVLYAKELASKLSATMGYFRENDNGK